MRGDFVSRDNVLELPCFVTSKVIGVVSFFRRNIIVC